MDGVIESIGRKETGAGDESRTRDLNLGKVALYQLSYSRTKSRFSSPQKAAGGAKRNRTAVNGFAIRCITTLLSRRRSFPKHALWSGRRVSNSRPQPWQGCALPTELLPRRRMRILHRPRTLSSPKIKPNTARSSRPLKLRQKLPSAFLFWSQPISSLRSFKAARCFDRR